MSKTLKIKNPKKYYGIKSNIAKATNDLSLLKEDKLASFRRKILVLFFKILIY